MFDDKLINKLVIYEKFFSKNINFYIKENIFWYFFVFNKDLCNIIFYYILFDICTNFIEKKFRYIYIFFFSFVILKDINMYTNLYLYICIFIDLNLETIYFQVNEYFYNTCQLILILSGVFNFIRYYFFYMFSW